MITMNASRIRLRPAAVGLSLGCCWALVAAALSPVLTRAEGAAWQVLFTADTEGSVELCGACPRARGDGDIARRATLVANLRKSDPSTLLLDAGNAFMGLDSLESRGKLMLDAYNAVRYDVVNVAWRDFRLGKDATVALLKEAKFAPVSANVMDAVSGQLLAKPYVVNQAGGQRVAVIGVTEVPAGAETLPHLKRQLGGLRLRPPVEALVEWLPKAKAESDRAVLLYYGTAAAGLKAVLDAAGTQVDAVLVGGLRPDQLPTDHVPPVIGAEEHGKSLTRITWDNPKAKPKVAVVTVDAATEPEAEVAGVVKTYIEDPAVFTAPKASPAAEPGAVTDGPLKLEAEILCPKKGANGSAKLRVTRLVLTASRGALKADDGHLLLLVHSDWENTIPTKPSDNGPLNTGYRVPSLRDHVYVVVNGREAARVHPDAAKIEGSLGAAELSVPRYGDVKSGELVFDVPVTAVEQLDLRFYDFVNGNISLALLGPKDPSKLVEAKPVAALRKNLVLEGGLYGVTKATELGAARAPAGMQYLLLDLRARSLAKINNGRSGAVADWPEPKKYAQLVVDGEQAYAPVDAPSATLGAEPRFLPDVMTGGTLVFLVPQQQMQSLELRCDFPNARMPDGKVVRPEPLIFALEGQRPKLTDAPAIAATKDDVFDVAVVGQQSSTEFDGVSASGGQQFLVLDVVVKNRGKQPEFFQVRDQLKYVAESGGQAEMDAASFAPGPRHPLPLIYIPAGERRAFRAAYAVPAAEKRPRLLYVAVTEGASKTLDLKPIQAGTPVVAVDTAKPVSQTTERRAADNEPAASPPSQRQQNQPQQKQPPRVVPAKKSKEPPANEPRPHGPPQGLAGVGLTPEQVNAAIDKGAAGLWKYIKEHDFGNNRDAHLGDHREHALSALALIHAGAHKRFPDCDAEIRHFLATRKPHNVGTYEGGLLCLTVEAYGDATFMPKLRGTARYLLEGQGPRGVWDYGVDVPDKLFATPVDTRVLQVNGGTPLEGPGSDGEQYKRLTDQKLGQDGDNSVSQFAMLGLQAAARLGIRMPPDTWQRALAETLKRQDEDGGWAYHGQGSSYGSMTSAGICAVAICRSQLGEAEPTVHPAITRGLAWLDKNFTVTENPPGEGNWIYYYLYSVERVGRILDTEFIGANEWYPLGARQLVGAQAATGLWTAKGQEQDPRLATSFALLFLTRATPTLTAKPKRGGDGTLRTAVLAPANRFYIILDASGSMLDEMDGKMKFDVARDAVQALIDELPKNSEVALRVYGHRKRAIEEGADQDTELKIPMAPLNREQFSATLQSLRCRGKTPLALSLDDAIQDLRGGSGDAEHPVTALLLTDGGEDTAHPRRDPVAAAAKFAALKGVSLHIVGFDINQEDWAQQLVSMAKAAKARYWPAAKATDLRRNLRAAVLGVPEQFAVLDKDGRVAASGTFGESKRLPEGKYTLQVDFIGQRFSEQFWINTDGTTSVTFDASRVDTSKAGAATAVPATPSATPAAPVATQTKAPEAKKPKFCTNCGAKLKEGAKFCTECGTKVPE